MPVYQSRVLTCVFYPGGPVSMCRHVCVPPISDCALILYMNLLFCGTWLAWINFCIHLYTNTIYCIKQKMKEKKKMFIIWCWLLCKYNIFTIKVLYCYDRRCSLFVPSHLASCFGSTGSRPNMSSFLQWETAAEKGTSICIRLSCQFLFVYELKEWVIIAYCSTANPKS